jgi:hypothetical protein
MKKSELTAMIIDELKALAKKMKIKLPAGAKKAEIVDALMAADAAASIKSRKQAVAKKPAESKRAVEKKPARRASAEKSGRPSSHEWKMPAGIEEPLIAQERVADAKYYTGAQASEKAAPSSQELPHGYNEDKIALMVRDPYWAFAYWEVTQARIDKEKAWFGWNSKLCVRLYDISGVQFDGRNAIGYFDQEVYERMGNWYFDLGRPTHSFCAELGLLSPEGRFLTLARSNYITMPRDGVSDVLDEEWMLLEEDFWKLYGFPGGSSPQLQEMWKRMRMHGITSPGMFSREKAKRK